jgi:hypothetical protein
MRSRPGPTYLYEHSKLGPGASRFEAPTGASIFGHPSGFARYTAIAPIILGGDNAEAIVSPNPVAQSAS